MNNSLQKCAPFIAKRPPSAGFERIPLAGVTDGSAITGDLDPISRLLALPAHFGGAMLDRPERGALAGSEGVRMRGWSAVAPSQPPSPGPRELIQLRSTSTKTTSVNLLHVDLSGLPPIMVYYSNHEMLAGEAIACAKRAKDARVDVSLHFLPEGPHNFILGAGRVPEVDRAIEKMVAWLRSKLVSQLWRPRGVRSKRS